jgi:monothiol glutaredoxin
MGCHFLLQDERRATEKRIRTSLGWLSGGQARIPRNSFAFMSKNELAAPVREKLDQLVGDKETVLFMKGTKAMPQCGFSARVVQILNGMGVEYRTVNVLADPDVREGMKLYTDWPTFPQLYHQGAFVGGCDIVSAMAEKGELATALGAAKTS